MKMPRYILLAVSLIVFGASLVPSVVAQDAPAGGAAPAGGGRAGRGGGGRGGGGRGGGGGGGATRGAPIPETAHSIMPVTTPVAQPDSDGFIPRWLILEPIPCNGNVTDNAVQATVKQEWFPNQLTVMPKDGDKVTSNGAEYIWHAVDTKNYNVDLCHFGYFLGKNTSNAIFWGLTVVNCPEELKNVRLAAGSNSATVWWVNGKEVVDIYGDIQTTVDDGVSKRLTLKKGANVIRVALVNNGGQTDFCARILDEQGNPVKNFTVTLSDSGR